MSALDVSIQAQVINLLSDLRERFGLTMLFISHDLDVVEYLCDRIVVLYLGKVMEVAPAKALYETPQASLHARRCSKRRRGRTRKRGAVAVCSKGDIPSPVDPPSGCVFRTRCPYALRCVRRNRACRCAKWRRADSRPASATMFSEDP